MDEVIKIDCPHCEDRVEAKIARPWLDHQYEYRLGILWCLRCNTPLVAHQVFLGPVGRNGHEEYADAQRVWPLPEATLSQLIPDVIRASLEEAGRCFSCGAYTASVVMTGRGIEGMCRHFKTKKNTLFDGMKELLQRDIIDKRLYEWAEALRTHRNLAAHATGETFSRQDAQDVFDFALAICEYVFVLSAKFDDFTRRTSKRPRKRSPSPTKP